MTLLIDTNILLDVLMDRQQHRMHSSLVWKLCETGLADGYICALSFADIVYIMRKTLEPKKINVLIESLSLIFRFEDLKGSDLIKAAALQWDDYEDALQAIAAERIHADYIVTRNTTDYRNSPVPAITPTDLLQLFPV